MVRLFGWTRRSLLVTLAPIIAAACAVTPSLAPPTAEPSLAVESTVPAPTSPVSSEPMVTPGPEVSDGTTPMPSPPGLASLTVAERAVEPSHQGGCWVVYYLGEWVTGDQCGPDPFDLEAASTRIAPAAELVIGPPAGWSFSVDDVRDAIAGEAADAWIVTIGPVLELAKVPLDRRESIYLSAAGQRLGAGQEPADTISVTTPTKPGEYLLELRAYVAQDGWTWGAVLYHWRISVG